jgi:nitroreductase
MTTGFDLAQTDRLLTTTRAVRKRLDLSRPVERDVIIDCLRIAIQAPTGSNSQRWRWLIVDDPSVRAGLADLYRRSAKPYTSAGRAAVEQTGRHEMNRILDSSEYLTDHLHEVPVHVIPCLLDRLPQPVSAMDAAGFYGSIVPAAWSFMLALRSRGPGIGLDNSPSRLRARSRRTPRHPRDRDPNGPHPCGLLHRRRLQGRPAPPRGRDHLLERMAPDSARPGSLTPRADSAPLVGGSLTGQRP